jgi:hypothetical protein
MEFPCLFKSSIEKVPNYKPCVAGTEKDQEGARALTPV